MYGDRLRLRLESVFHTAAVLFSVAVVLLLAAISLTLLSELLMKR